MCGAWMVSMKDVVFGAFMDYHNDAEIEKKELLTNLKKYGW